MNADAIIHDVDTMASCPQPELSEPGPGADAAVEERNAITRCKTQQSNVAQPRTLAWAESLPRDIQPQLLLRSFARIANLIALQWDEPRALYAYFGELLIDRRKGRKGFPPEVRSELLALRAHYSHLDLQRCMTRRGVGKGWAVRHHSKSLRRRSAGGF